MNTVERIFDLIRKSKKSEYAIKKETGLPNSTFSEWRAGRAKPSAEALKKIADYFDVSVDYLLGRTDDPSPIRARTPVEENGLVIPPVLQDPALRVAFHEGFTGLNQRDIDELARMAELLAAKNRENKE